jgi:hypothetical protein
MEPTWTAGQVAEKLGVALSTLRAWHRRYGVGPEADRPGGYRRYTGEDVARLQRMHDLIIGGTLPSDAARVVAVPNDNYRAESVLTEVLGAARELDSGKCVALLGQSLTALGAVRCWDEVCRPALRQVDAEQHTEGADEDDLCVDTEHVLSWAITAAFHRVSAARTTRGRPSIVLSCTDAEQHTLPLEALAVALGERGVPVRMLGAAVPTSSLVHTVTTTPCDVVVLWAQRRESARTDTVRALRRLPVRRLVAGPGWPRKPPAGTEPVHTLADAVALLA